MFGSVLFKWIVIYSHEECGRFCNCSDCFVRLFVSLDACGSVALQLLPPEAESGSRIFEFQMLLRVSRAVETVSQLIHEVH